jgi:hypothetical protein
MSGQCLKKAIVFQVFYLHKQFFGINKKAEYDIHWG